MEPLKIIRQIRREQNIKQVDIAKKLSISQSNYAKLENGKIELTVAKLNKLAEVLDVHPVDILYPGMLDKTINYAEESKLLKKIEQAYNDVIKSKTRLIDELSEKADHYKQLFENYSKKGK